MAKKKSPNADLIAALKAPERIPYDPELLEAIAEHDRKAWDEFNRLRREVYRILMPTIWSEVLDAEQAGDVEQAKLLDLDADRRWREATGLPAITSFSKLETIMAAIQAAGYPPSDAGLRAWTYARVQQGKEPDRTTATDIPAEFRTKAITKTRAALLLRGGNPDSAVEWLNQCIEDGTVSCETLSRQSHVFDVRQFPESARDQLLPTAGKRR